MPKREQLLNQLSAAEDYGILLTAQIGGVPNELQLIVGTAKYDSEVEGLRPQNHYIIRALGVFEHQLHLGVFGTLAFTTEHPVLQHYNYPLVAVAFEGKPQNVYELILDITQTYSSIFATWRHLVDDINHAAPLTTLLESGKGVLGQFPKPAAERLAKVFAHHKIQTTLHEEENFEREDKHGRSKEVQLLAIDNAYIIALSFSVEEMGKV